MQRQIKVTSRTFLQGDFFEEISIFKRTTFTAKNTIISSNFLVWKFCGKAQFPHSFVRFAQNYEETVPFHKISTPLNQVKLRVFLQWSAPYDFKTSTEYQLIFTKNYQNINKQQYVVYIDVYRKRMRSSQQRKVSQKQQLIFY